MAYIIHDHRGDVTAIYVGSVFKILRDPNDESSGDMPAFMLGVAICTTEDDPRLNFTPEEWQNNMSKLDFRLPPLGVFGANALISIISDMSLMMWAVHRQEYAGEQSKNVTALPDAFNVALGDMNLDPGADYHG